MSFVSVKNLFQNYGTRPIIERINLSVDEGEFISIVGASGCGKSTFLRLLLAQERPTRGEVTIADAPPAKEPGLDRGVVFQRYSVFPHLTVRENIVAGESFRRPWGRFFGQERQAAQTRADETLARCGLDQVRQIKATKPSICQVQMHLLAQAAFGPDARAIPNE
jgi:NitT/TauT family transport system ATP-binding protein